MAEGEKALASPFATGGGGPGFEVKVQALFAVLLLSGGTAPCIRRRITKIKLQGRYAGFNTDDFIAFDEDAKGKSNGKLLAQIKHGAAITESNQAFAEAIVAAWNDFKKPEIFDPELDAIALITGPQSATDIEHARRILDWARHSGSAEEFLLKVNTDKFSAEKKQEKLKAFREQLKAANAGVELSDDEVWRFLRCFHLLGYDLDVEAGVTLSLLESHISQFNEGKISFLWEGIAQAISSANQDAGTLVLGNFPKAIRDIFAKPVSRVETPAPAIQPGALTGDQTDALAFVGLVGALNERVPGDMDAVQKLMQFDD